MDHSRRNFLAGLSAAAMFSTVGIAGTTIIQTIVINGKRYAMVHDETLCIGCEACVDACRETNNVPEAVSRLEIIRSEPRGEFPDADYKFFRKSCQHCQ